MQAQLQALDIKMLPYQLRVVDEEEQLHIKLIALLDFIEQPSFAEIDLPEQYRLKLQAMSMGHYHLVLTERISHFKS